MPLDADQYAYRLGKITASIVPAILGLNRWKSPLDAWLEITGKHVREVDEKTKKKQAHGHRMESAMLGWYSEDEGVQLAHFGTVEHPKYPWALATPDAVTLDFGFPVFVEGKSVGLWTAGDWGEPEDPMGIPDYVFAQGTWQMFVGAAAHGFRRIECHVPAHFGGTDFRLYRFEYDEKAALAIFQRVERWYQVHIVGKTAPPVDESTTVKTIETLYPTGEGVHVAPPEAAAWALKYRTASEAIKAAETEKESAKKWLCASLGPMESMVLKTTEGKTIRVSWKNREETVVKEYTRAAYRHFECREIKATKKGK